VTTGWRLRADELTQHGDRVALTGVRDDVSYTKLHGRADAVANALIDAGVNAGDAVALLSTGRQFDEPAGLAGILMVGATAVPLDASSPVMRLDTIMADRGCVALVHDQAAHRILASIETLLARIELDEDGFVTSSIGATPLERPVPNPERACILHTSGSTGKPKPVPISWAGLDAFTAWTHTITGLNADDRVLRVADLIFDLAWFDHIATWRAGATLATMSRRQLATARSLRTAMETLRPTVVYGVPAMFMKLVAGLGDDKLHDQLGTICFAGEVFPPADLRQLAERAPNARLYNLFGPTETNVCTFHEVRRDELDGESELPIGIACPYAACSLIDEDGTTIDGPGIGELIVTGPTALGGTFATRDRVERRADGLYYFRGRIDRMVKIRGFRVDPGEVEAALRSHAQVQEAAVVVVVHPRLGKTLHAHVTPRDAEAPPEQKTLRAHLAARIAPYMVPEKVHVRDDLPRTATGKIDYPALTST
jgi:acyl-coenzyme A synthetase/AMP-(fatty) acid ligase